MSPVAELHKGHGGPWPPLALQILHYINSNIDTIYHCSIRVAPPHSSDFFNQAPPVDVAIIFIGSTVLLQYSFSIYCFEIICLCKYCLI